MPYLGHPPSTGEENNFKILDDISSYTLTFDGSSSSVVSTSDETIYSYNHRFVQGQRVTYNNGGGGNIAGLTSGTVYYIIKQDHNNIQLATSAANAASGTAVNITAVGTGASHTLNVAFDGTNTKFKATHTTGQKARITRGAQLVLSINGVIQQPHDSSTPSTGFGFDVDGTIIFSEAPASTDAFWGHILTNNNVTFDISDNKIDHFTGDGSTLAFTLSKSPPNNENILVTIDGVVQYPNDSAGNIRSYSTAANVISFTSAPGSGTAIEVRHIGFAGATSGGGGGVTGFYGRTGNAVLKSTDHITTGNIVAGVVTATNAVITGDLTVNGTTTTLDTNLIGVDRLEVDANNTTVAVAVTQSGAGDLVRLFDSTTEKLRITDDGLVGIGTNNPQKTLNVFAGVGTTELIRLSQPVDASVQQEFGIGWCSNNNHTHPGAQITSLEYDVSDPRRDLLFYTRGVNSDSAPTERLRITSAGNLKLPDSAKIELGGVQTGSGDLQIWHDGSHSRIHNDTGHLLIETDAASAIEINKGVSENLAKFIPDGAVELYYDAVKKVETTSAGAKITGNLEVTGVLTYDDVTNIDSVGIVTARTGIHIDDSITHIGDTNTKIRFPSADTVSVETAGSERLNITASAVSASTMFKSDSFESNANLVLNSDSNANNSTNDSIIFKNAGTERVRIKGNGNTGIGTASPQERLHLYAGNCALEVDAPANRYCSVGFSVDGASKWWMGRGDSDVLSETSFFIGKDAGSATDKGGNSAKFVIDSSGNILLSKGTQNTLMSNTSDGSDNQSIFVGGGGGPSDTRGAYIWAKGNEYTTTGGYLQLNAGNVGTAPITFSTGGNERLRITSAGLVGINQTPSTAQLVVKNSDDANRNSIDVFNDNGNVSTSISQDSSGSGSFIQKNNSGTIKTFIKSYGDSYFTGGKIGIGIANPVGNLEVRDSKANLIVAKTGLTVKANSALHTTYDFFQIGAGGAIASYSTETVTASTHFIHNAYRGTDAAWKRRYADTAMRLSMNSPGGAFRFESAASGSANADITFSEKVRITSAGSVGIGTDNPQRLLHLYGGTAGTTILLTNPSTGHTTSDGSQINIRNDDNGFTLSQNENSYMNFRVNGSERLRITSDGQLAIASSTNKTDIHSSFKSIQVYNHSYIWGYTSASYPAVHITNNARPTTSSFTSGWKRDVAGTYTAPVQLELYHGNFNVRTADNSTADSDISWDTRFTVRQDGNLRATSAADVRLTLGSSGTAGTNNSVHVRADSADLKFMAASGGNTIFEENGTEKLRINSIGNVSIGGASATPSNAAYNGATLHLYQSGGSGYGSEIKFSTGVSGHTASDGAYMAFYSDNNMYCNIRESGNWKFYTSNLERFCIKSDGQVQISNSNPPASGALFVSDDGSATTISSGATARIANNGSSASYAIAEIQSGNASWDIRNSGDLYHKFAGRHGHTIGSTDGSGAYILLDGAEGNPLSSGSDYMYMEHTSNGQFEMWNGNGSSSTAKFLNATKEGYVTKPKTPYFHVQASPEVTNSPYDNSVKTFDNIRVNNGGHYSNSTGIFTVPVAGFYWFSAGIWASTSDNTAGTYILMLIRRDSNGGNEVQFAGANHRHSKNQLTVSAGYYCATGDKIYLEWNGSIQGSTPRNYFSGCLIA